MSKRSFWIWCIGTVLVCLEIIYAGYAYYKFRERVFIGYGWQSVGELFTSLVSVFYLGALVRIHTKREKAGQTPIELEHDHEVHPREAKAVKYVSRAFYALAVMTFAWIPFSQSDPVIHEGVWSPQIILGSFTTLTIVMTIIKRKLVPDKHGPQDGDYLMGVMCIASGFIAGIADWLQRYFAYSDVIGNMFIGGLLIWIGYQTQKNKRLCEHC